MERGQEGREVVKGWGSNKFKWIMILSNGRTVERFNEMLDSVDRTHSYRLMKC